LRSISDTIRRLAALRSKTPLPRAAADIRDELADLTGFGTNPGALRARVYVPDNLPDAAPLVVVLHGCTQSAANYDHGSGWSLLADQEGFALLFPEQQRSNNSNLCFNWFQQKDAARNRGEALSIRQMIEALVVAHRLDRQRIFITGLSAGGAMASVMLATYPEVFAGGAIIAGLPYGAANTIPEAFDRMRGHGLPSKRQSQEIFRRASTHKGPWPTISVWHGSADPIVSPSNSDAIVGQWLAVHDVSELPAGEEIADGYSRQVWRDAEGRSVIEKCSIFGMGHGTPLATGGKAGLGAEAPFMLEVGLSSTRHIAHFWGIDSVDGRRRSVDIRRHKHLVVAPPSPEHAALLEDIALVEPLATSERKISSPHATRTAAINKVITDALRSAGLMR
jgi:poly(hydroxyalkanoate) depolymerase family esterase